MDESERLELEELFEAMYMEANEVLAKTEKMIENRFQGILDKVKQDIEEYNSTGVLPMDGFSSIKVAEAMVQQSTTALYRASSIKENESELANQNETQRLTRGNRTTSIKSNRPTTTKVVDKVLVKMERISENFNTTQTIVPNDSEIKKEPMDMPPPPRPPLKRTRAQKALQISTSNVNLDNVVIKQEIINNHAINHLPRESDVVVQTNKVLNITVIDSDEEGQPLMIKPLKTRTKKRRLPNIESSASEESENDVKKQCPDINDSARMTRSRTKPRPKGNDQQVLKELQITLNNTVVLDSHNKVNSTVIIEKNSVVANETYIMNKHAFSDREMQLLTDDEDIIDNSVKETKETRKKQIFSPYAGSPVKKRVAAFEKLGVQAEINPHSTRAKNKKLAESATSEEDDSPNNNNQKKTAIPKLRVTPTINNRILSHTQDHHQTNPTSSLARSKSALKASQAEFRERELRRQQKESEAAFKKEALMNAQIEERRRRNEERQLKAQQQRDAMEKEKQQLLEAAEIAKSNKVKLLLAEKDEKFLKQKEDANKKRLLALKKTALEKQKEEKQKLKDEMKKAQVKVKNDIPLLPTADCYDSDDSTHANVRVVKPAWQNAHSLYEEQKKILFLGKLVDKLFSCKPQYPDIRKIFPNSKPVPRNSSVIWDTSNVSKLPSMIEEED